MHACTSLWWPHATPPLVLAADVVRVRVCVPAPQVTEHADHGAHADCTQSSGHACALQFCSSVSIGQNWPPNEAGVVTVRERSSVPPPQDFEHGPNAVHADTTQSTGHGSVLHVLVSERNGHT